MPTNVLDFPDPLLTEYLARQSEVFDLSEAAAFLKSSEHEVLRLVREQGLPARAVGDGWRFLKGAICRWLGSAQPPQSDREALLAGAGIFQDDPDLNGMDNRPKSFTANHFSLRFWVSSIDYTPWGDV